MKFYPNLRRVRSELGPEALCNAGHAFRSESAHVDVGVLLDELQMSRVIGQVSLRTKPIPI